MIPRRVDELKEDDILARPVMIDKYRELLAENTKLKKEYIVKLKEFAIDLVYIREREIYDEEEIIHLKITSTSIMKDKIQNILQSHIHQDNSDLQELSEAADSIIEGILSEEQVLERIFDIRERSADIYEHSLNVCIFSVIIAIKEKLSKSIIHDIGVGCLLHELGLRYIISDFDNKSLNQMPKYHAEEYKKHPIYGYYAIETEDWLNELSKNIILNHHERKDGSGFPLKIKDYSKEIMIVNICDTFDEMISGIGFARVKVYEAVEFLKSYAAQYFDPHYVELFLQITAVYPTNSVVKTNEGETGVVIRQNKQFPERPVLKIVKDKDGNPVEGLKYIDLLKVHDIFIEEVIM